MTAPDKKPDSPPTSRKKTVLLILVGAAALVVAGVVAAILLKNPNSPGQRQALAESSRPHEYFVKDPNEPKQREALAKRAAEQQRALGKDAGSVASAVEDEAPHPIERLSIVWAIQAYYINVGKPPEDVRSLAVIGLLPDTRLIQKYRLEYDGPKWTLRHVKSNRIVAVGN